MTMASDVRVPRKMTATYVDQMTTQRRAEELGQKELVKYGEENAMLSHAAQRERRLAFQRRANAAAQVKEETTIQTRKTQQEAKAWKDALISRQNQDLAEELQRRRAAKTRHEVEIQRICQESEELRALEQRLLVAYVNKERAAQQADNQLLLQMERDKEQAIADKMEHDRQMALKAEADKVAMGKKLSEAQRSALHAQMQEREALKREDRHSTIVDYNLSAQEDANLNLDRVLKLMAQEHVVEESSIESLAIVEAERDREMVEAVVKRVEAEEKAEREQYLRSREETRRVVQEAERQRSLELDNRAKQEKEEKENIAKYMEMVAEREAKAEEERLRKKAATDAAFKAVVEETEKLNNEEDELRQLRDMLWKEELEAKRIQDDEERRRKQAESKVAMMEANEEQLRQRRERQEADKIEEDRLVQIMFDKFKTDDEREKMETEKREHMKKEHWKNMEEQRRERVALYEMEKALEIRETEAAEERKIYRQKVIEEARRRLLEQHASAVEGYLPKATLKCKDELEYVRNLARGDVRCEDRATRAPRATPPILDS